MKLGNYDFFSFEHASKEHNRIVRIILILGKTHAGVGTFFLSKLQLYKLVHMYENRKSENISCVGFPNRVKKYTSLSISARAN